MRPLRSAFVVIALPLLVVSSLGCKKLLHRHDDGGLTPPEPPMNIVDASSEGADAAAAAGDPDAGDAGAPMIATAAPIAPHVAPVAPGTIPIGTFVGQVKEGPLNYSMTVVLNATGGSVTYTAPFTCKGTWSLGTHDGGKFRYRERITEQGSGKHCASGDTSTLTEVKPGAVYSWQEGSASATLSKR